MRWWWRRFTLRHYSFSSTVEFSLCSDDISERWDLLGRLKLVNGGMCLHFNSEYKKIALQRVNFSVFSTYLYSSCSSCVNKLFMRVLCVFLFFNVLCCHSKWIIIRDGIFICSFIFILNELICFSTAHCVPLAVLSRACLIVIVIVTGAFDEETTGNSTKHSAQTNNIRALRMIRIISSFVSKLSLRINKKFLYFFFFRVESWCCDKRRIVEWSERFFPL